VDQMMMMAVDSSNKSTATSTTSSIQSSWAESSLDGTDGAAKSSCIDDSCCKRDDAPNIKPGGTPSALRIRTRYLQTLGFVPPSPVIGVTSKTRRDDRSPRPSCMKRNGAKSIHRKTSFHPTVTVHSIPSHRDYSRRMKRLLWMEMAEPSPSPTMTARDHCETVPSSSRPSSFTLRQQHSLQQHFLQAMVLSSVQRQWR
jgi:hypothetical protein